MFHAQIKGVDVGLPTHLRDFAKAWNNMGNSLRRTCGEKQGSVSRARLDATVRLCTLCDEFIRRLMGY